MDVLQATEQFLIDIHDSTKRQESISQFEIVVLWPAGRTVEIRKITVRLVVALQEETDPGVKHAIFWILESAVSYCNQEEFVDWDAVIRQLPLLSEEGLDVALDMFYSRLQLLDIPVLETYLEHPSLTIRMNALNIICETIAFASHRDKEVEAKLRPGHYHHLQVLINTPKRRKQIPEAELEKRFFNVYNEIMKYIRVWLDRNS